ncbi:MAG: C39 family peptidase [Anaerolineae bacterium]|nr:C39 family peptidase [Anaerolineae bacterium]
MPLCVEMVLTSFGQTIDSAWLRRVLESRDIGTPGFKVLNLQKHGYQVTYADATDERALTNALKAGIPPILLLMTTHLPYWSRATVHAVVVVGWGEDNIIVHDPAFPHAPQTIWREAFMLAWSDFDYLSAIIQP